MIGFAKRNIAKGESFMIAFGPDGPMETEDIVPGIRVGGVVYNPSNRADFLLCLDAAERLGICTFVVEPASDGPWGLGEMREWAPWSHFAPALRAALASALMASQPSPT